jgi:hypothetical protein
MEIGHVDSDYKCCVPCITRREKPTWERSMKGLGIKVLRKRATNISREQMNFAMIKGRVSNICVYI